MLSVLHDHAAFDILPLDSGGALALGWERDPKAVFFRKFLQVQDAFHRQIAPQAIMFLRAFERQKHGLGHTRVGVTWCEPKARKVDVPWDFNMPSVDHEHIGMRFGHGRIDIGWSGQITNDAFGFQRIICADQYLRAARGGYHDISKRKDAVSESSNDQSTSAFELLDAAQEGVEGGIWRW